MNASLKVGNLDAKAKHDNRDNKNVRVLAACFHIYTGNPCWITGHAIRRALNINNRVSNGLFTLETSLFPVKTYRDYFKMRLQPEPLMHSDFRGFGRGKKYCYTEFKPTCLTFDISGTSPEIKPGRWFSAGGRKNSGYGNFKIIEIAEIDLNELVYPDKVEWARLVTPMAMKSLPRQFSRKHIKRGVQWYYHGMKKEIITTAGAGQVFKLGGKMNSEEQKKVMFRGIRRIGNRSSLGLGEYYCF